MVTEGRSKRPEIVEWLETPSTEGLHSRDSQQLLCLHFDRNSLKPGLNLRMGSPEVVLLAAPSTADLLGSFLPRALLRVDSHHVR